MPVPSTLSDLSTTASANSPQGTESAKGTIDDYLRSHAAFIAQLNALVAGATVTLASGATVAIGAAQSLNIAITGTSTISAFDTAAEGVMRWVAFAGALTLTHNATSLVLPGAASLAVSAGDVAVFKSLGGGNWKCVAYQPAAGNVTTAGLAAAVAGKTIPGSVAFTGQVIVKQGVASSPGLTFASDVAFDSGFYQPSDGVIVLVCNGVPVARFSQANGLEAIKVTQVAL
jgi:hypothetical protein